MGVDGGRWEWMGVMGMDGRGWEWKRGVKMGVEGDDTMSSGFILADLCGPLVSLSKPGRFRISC